MCACVSGFPTSSCLHMVRRFLSSCVRKPDLSSVFNLAAAAAMIPLQKQRTHFHVVILVSGHAVNHQHDREKQLLMIIKMCCTLLDRVV